MTTAQATSPYQHYVYAYPHKTAYRPLPERPTLAGPHNHQQPRHAGHGIWPIGAPRQSRSSVSP